MHFFSFSFQSLTFRLYLYFFVLGIGPRDLILFRLPLLRLLPCSIRIFFYVVVQLLFLFLIYRFVFLLLMDEQSRAVAQFYPMMEGNGGLGGMNGGFNPPPVPDTSPVLAAASHEAGPSVSDPKSHLFEEERRHLDRLRGDNLRRLKENENLLKQAEAGLRRLEEDFSMIQARDAQRDAAARLKKEELYFRREAWTNRRTNLLLFVPRGDPRLSSFTEARKGFFF